MLASTEAEGGMPAMRLYMRVAWSAFGEAACAFMKSASAPAQVVARSASVTRRGRAARPTSCVIGFSIPYFMCTSTRVSCGFNVAPI